MTPAVDGILREFMVLNPRVADVRLAHEIHRLRTLAAHDRIARERLFEQLLDGIRLARGQVTKWRDTPEVSAHV